MNKIYSLIIFAFFAILSSNSFLACIVTIPDANFKAYLVGNSAINTDADAEIQCSEASAFTGTIGLFGTSFSDMTGLEAFTSITQLNIIGAQITTIDLTANTALTNVNLEGTLLTSVNVSTNTALTILNVWGGSLQTITFGNNSLISQLWIQSNQLTAVNLSSLTALTQLFCKDNQLSELNLNANTSLYYLECSNNDISSLEFTTNSALGLVSCDNNLLTSLDVSSNPTFFALFCSGNPLSSLNVANGNNTNMTNFVANNNPNLTCIQVDNAAYSTANWVGGNYSFDAGASFDVNCNATSTISEINDEVVLTIFPNPANTFITISANKPVLATITSINGAVLTKLNVNGETSIDVSNYSSGVYFIRTSEGQTVKFLKE